MAIAQVRFKVLSNPEIIDNVRLLTVTSEQDTTFLAGQYYSFKIEDKVNRSYSIASSPNQKNIEFLVEIIEGGKGSTFINNLKVGDEFYALGPLGFFTLENYKVLENESPLIFAGTGTGIAPIRSMIIHLLKDLHSTREIKLFFGMRFDNHVYYFDEFEKLAKEFPNFHFTPIISRPSESWKGATGHCQDFIMKDPVDENAKVYICGSNQAVQGISQDLINYGYKKENILFEKFG